MNEWTEQMAKSKITNNPSPISLCPLFPTVPFLFSFFFLLFPHTPNSLSHIHNTMVQPQATTDLLPIIDLGLYMANPDAPEAIAEAKRVCPWCMS